MTTTRPRDAHPLRPRLSALTEATATLVLPTFNEADAIDTVARLAHDVRRAGVVQRVVLIDGGSTDGTVAAARAAGLEVVAAADIAPGAPVLGKGDSVWRAGVLPDDDTDVVVCRDADVDGVGPDDIAALVAAVAAEGVALAKGHFVRLQYADGPARPTSGRITEFTARPLLAVLAPELSHVVEPLSGQFAIRRDVLRAVPVVTHYGVDVGLVLAVARRWGPDAVVSVDVGRLSHRAKQDASLVPMAHDVAATILAGTAGHLDVAAPPPIPSGRPEPTPHQPVQEPSDATDKLPSTAAVAKMVVRPAHDGGSSAAPARTEQQGGAPGRPNQ